MEIWLKQENSTLRIPVLPPSYSVTSTQNNQKISVYAIGEINLFGKRGLETLSFESFFPNKYNSSYCEYSSYPTPQECVEMVKIMKESGPIKLIMTECGINMNCTIDSFDHGEEDGSGDIKYSISLSEYIYLNIPKSALVDATVQEAGYTRDSKSASSGTYTVKSGECLSIIAKKQTGSASNWRAIYNANKSIIGSNPNKIYPGQVLTIQV